MRTLMTIMLFLAAFGASAANAGETKQAVLYKDPACGCCQAYAGYLRENGFAVTVRPTENMSLIKQRHSVPERFEGCHTLLVDGYVIEGHVPISAIERLLDERPAIKGISLPGMPQGSPGMSGRQTAPFTVYELTDGAPKVYAVE